MAQMRRVLIALSRMRTIMSDDEFGIRLFTLCTSSILHQRSGISSQRFAHRFNIAKKKKLTQSSDVTSVQDFARRRLFKCRRLHTSSTLVMPV